MTACPYTQLIVRMYQLPPASKQLIATALTAADKRAMLQAITNLSQGVNQERTRLLLKRRYGFEPFHQSESYAAIGSSLAAPITSSRVREIVLRAEHLLSKNLVFQSILNRLVQSGVGKQWSHDSVTLPTAAVATLLQEHQLKTFGCFFLDCTPQCTMDQPCPTCQARKLAKMCGVFDALQRYAIAYKTETVAALLSTLSVAEIGLSQRVVYCLQSNHIHTLGQLRQKTQAELMRLPYFHRQHYLEVQAVLATLGLASVKGR